MKRIIFMALIIMVHTTVSAAIIICRNPFSSTKQRMLATCCINNAEQKTVSVVWCDGKLTTNCLCKKPLQLGKAEGLGG